MVSAAAATPATQTNNHVRADEKRPVNGKVVGDDHTVHAAPASPPPARNNGAYRVQLAASRSEEYIRRDWSSYQQHYGDIFAGLDASFERAEVGEEKTVWYRLRVGPFTSEASARALCETLSARGIKTGCLPLRTAP